MARRREIDAAVRAASFSDEEITRLANRLYTTKLRVYRATLRDLADRFTRSGAPSAIPLSAEVKDALMLEAEGHAAKIAQTHNAAVAKRGEELGGWSRDALREALSTFSNARRRNRAEQIAVTESYGPHADSIVSFFKDAGFEPLFDFGGHPDDSAPVCAICKAIVAANPHSLEDVVRIGVPHIACRQTWHPQFTEQLDDFDLGQTLGGIVNTKTLSQREGGEQPAADAVVGMQG